MEKVIATGRTFKLWEHKDWGNSIVLKNWKQRKVYGWIWPKIKDGDILLVPMESGKVGELIFENVSYCNNPSDMFFASIVDNGYSDVELTAQEKACLHV